MHPISYLVKHKRDFLLGFLSRHRKNIVDNLTTKDELTFTEVKQRLLDIDYDTPQHSALVTRSSGVKKPAKLTKAANVSKSQPKECTYCKKLHPRVAAGHFWTECQRLKQFKQNEAKGKTPTEEAHMTHRAEENVSKTLFYFDTCATAHMCPHPDRFEFIDACSGLVKSSSGGNMEVVGKGSVLLGCKLSDGTISSFLLKNVLYVPQLELPLFSWKKERLNGLKLYDNGNIMCLQKHDKTVIEAHFNGSLPSIPEVDLTDINIACSTYEFWHEALCHSAPSSVSKTKGMILNSELIPDCPANFHCQACSLSKSKHHTPKHATKRATHRGEYIHTDLCGPFPIISLSNLLYYISFVDDATRYSTVLFLKTKSDANQAIIDYILELGTQYGCRTKALRSDNGGEYVNEQLSNFFARKGISHDLTPPYSPESNGVAERLNRTIGEGIRAMLLPLTEKRLWAEAIQTFIYTKNRQTHNSVNGQTPYEAFHGEKPTINHLRPFGQECYVHIPKAARPSGSKLLPRATRGIFVGYTKVSHQYRIFNPQDKRIIRSADVKFIPFSNKNKDCELSLNQTEQLTD
ncbi:hypothetical protein K3495_g14775, partial [Podosphaera aphanis]